MLDFASDIITENGITYHVEPEITLIDKMGTDLSIVNAAKVSFGALSRLDADGMLKEKDQNLLKFLARGMTAEEYEDLLEEVRLEELTAYALETWRATPIHKSPFNHVMLSFRCKASIAVARQLVKHEYLVWNEVSGRYVEFLPEFLLPYEFRAHSDDVKQGSRGVVENQRTPTAIYKGACEGAYSAYRGMLASGVCREQARLLLPLSTMTEWVWTGSLFSFQKMCAARVRSDAQSETQDVAFAIQRELYHAFPYAMEALDTYGV